MLYCNDADWARATGRPNRVSVFQAAIPDHSQNYVRVQFSVTHDFHPFLFALSAILTLTYVEFLQVVD